MCPNTFFSTTSLKIQLHFQLAAEFSHAVVHLHWPASSLAYHMSTRMYCTSVIQWLVGEDIS